MGTSPAASISINRFLIGCFLAHNKNCPDGFPSHLRKSILTPLRSLSFLARLIISVKTFGTKVKINGERGSPCRSPLLHWIYLPSSPLSKIVDWPVLIHVSIHLIQRMPNPFRVRTSKTTFPIDTNMCFLELDFLVPLCLIPSVRNFLHSARANGLHRVGR